MPKIGLCDSYTGDHLVFDVSSRRTSDGYMVATAKVARTGIQLYKGDELGRPDLKVVRVYRPESEVFSNDSVRSYAHKPITLDHPPEMVTDGNWSKYAKGAIDADVIRDGEFIRVPMLLMDRKVIDAVSRGVKQLSVGYTMDLEFESGKTESGEAFDAVMSNIRVNHLAVVPAARGGPELAIGDESDDDTNKETKMGKRIVVDGLPVEVADDVGAEIVTKQLAKDAASIKDLTEKLQASTAEVKKITDAATVAAEEAKTQIGAKDGEIAVLKKAVEDAKVTPAALDKLVKERSEVIGKARHFLGDKFDFAPLELKDIKTAAVAKHLGDAVANGMDEATINGAFISMSKDVKVGDGVKVLAHALSNATTVDSTDAAEIRQKAFDESTAELENRWKPKAA